MKLTLTEHKYNNIIIVPQKYVYIDNYTSIFVYFGMLLPPAHEVS